MLIGAVALVAQVGAYKFRSLLTTGKKGAIEDVNPHAVGTAAHFAKALSRAPITEIVTFLDEAKGKQLQDSLLQHADDLDYLQQLATSLGNQSSLNPSLNAVIEACNRRRFFGRFKKGNQTVELDTLLQQRTKGDKDDDNASLETSLSRQTERLCFYFQRGACRFRYCNFQHKCSLCFSTAHGANSCSRRQWTRGRTTATATGYQGTANQGTERPPHPRFRRDRATNRNA